MCGIVGYTGKVSALTPVIEGLRRLEYRGYDSAGIAIPVEIGKPLFVEKRSGKLKNLEDSLGKTPKSNSGMAIPDGQHMVVRQIQMHIHI